MAQQDYLSKFLECFYIKVSTKYYERVAFGYYGVRDRVYQQLLKSVILPPDPLPSGKNLE